MVLMEMCEQVAVRLRKARLNTGEGRPRPALATNIAFYIGYSDTEWQPSLVKSFGIDATNSTAELQEAVRGVFLSKYKQGVVRHIGVTAGGLIPEPYHQYTLWEYDRENAEIERRRKEELIQDAVDDIRHKQKFTAIVKASALKGGSRQIARSKLIGGHTASGAGGVEGLG
jgi:DNA polymerase V